MKRILILFCGGTISMTKNIQTGSLDVAYGAEQLLAIEPRIMELAHIDLEFVANIDSANATPRLWEQIGSIISEKYNQYDGFLITMGTDTMAYMASALTFSLTNVGKPVIITGAQIPPSRLSTDARSNLINSLHVAIMDLCGVFIVFGNKIILGCRSHKAKLVDLDAFMSCNTKDAGKIGIEIRINDIQKSHSEALLLQNGFEDNIVSIVTSPGMRPEGLIRLIDEGVKGFILWGYGTGSVSDYLFPFLHKAQLSKIPVVVTTHCEGGTVMGVYSVGLEALKLGVIESYDMSIESMTTKLMRLLSQGVAYEDMKRMMQQDLHGEINMAQVSLFRNQELQESIENI